MAIADEIFIQNMNDIINNGTWDTDYPVRPHWADGTPAHTVKKFCIVNRYDLSKELPILTIRRTYFKSCLDELLWIWQKKSNNIHDLHSHVWDSWADETGSIGKAYGYQMGKKHGFKIKGGIEEMDQVDYARYLIKNDPASRRIMTNIFDFEDLKDMNLAPCAYGTQWLVKGGKLHLILNQRSQDMLAANGWNTMQYAALLCMFAKEAGLEPGTLTHNIGDCHIYDRHIPLVKQLLEAEPMDVHPKLVINNPSNNFYDFKVEDFEIQGYDYNHDVNIGKFEVAE